MEREGWDRRNTQSFPDLEYFRKREAGRRPRDWRKLSDSSKAKVETLE